MRRTTTGLLWCAGIAIAVSHGLPPFTGGDLVHDFYPAARQVLHGYLHYRQPPYTIADVDAFRYPPFAGVLFAPFALLSLHDAQIAWWLVSVIAVGATATVLARGLRLTVSAGLVFLGLMSFAPIAISLKDTVDPWLLLLTVGGIVALRRRSSVTGALIGVAAAVKLYPILALLVVAAARRPRRAVLGGAMGAIIVTTLVAIAIIGTNPFRAYFDLATTGSGTLTANPYAFGALNIATRLFAHSPYSVPLVAVGSSWIAVGFVVFVIAVFVLAGMHLRHLGFGSLWCVALLITVACSPFLEYAHLAPLALIPILMMMDSLLPRKAYVAGVAAFTACTVVAAIAPHHVAEAWSVLVAAAAAFCVRRLAGSPAGLVAAGLVILATPSFVSVSAFWPAPISVAHVLLGSLDFAAVLVVLAAMLIIPRPLLRRTS